jgi:hypothetical protein
MWARLLFADRWVPLLAVTSHFSVLGTHINEILDVSMSKYYWLLCVFILIFLFKRRDCLHSGDCNDLSTSTAVRHYPYNTTRNGWAEWSCLCLCCFTDLSSGVRFVYVHQDIWRATEQCPPWGCRLLPCALMWRTLFVVVIFRSTGWGGVVCHLTTGTFCITHLRGCTLL